MGQQRGNDRQGFACYIKDKLPYQSDYLVGHADCAVTFVSDKDGKMEVLKAYPEGEERRAINAVFDEIVADLKREQILTHSDVTLPLPAQPLAENEQISIFTAERPSVMAQLAAAKPAEKTTPAQAVPKKEPCAGDLRRCERFWKKIKITVLTGTAIIWNQVQS